MGTTKEMTRVTKEQLSQTLAHRLFCWEQNQKEEDRNGVETSNCKVVEDVHSTRNELANQNIR
jgi:hypothetical protein